MQESRRNTRRVKDTFIYFISMYEGVTSFHGNNVSRVNYTKNNWFMQWNFWRWPETLHRQNLIGKLIDFGAENAHLGTRLGYPVSVLLLQKQFLGVRVNKLAWNFISEKRCKDINTKAWNIKINLYTPGTRFYPPGVTGQYRTVISRTCGVARAITWIIAAMLFLDYRSSTFVICNLINSKWRCLKNSSHSRDLHVHAMHFSTTMFWTLVYVCLWISIPEVRRNIMLEREPRSITGCDWNRSEYSFTARLPCTKCTVCVRPKIVCAKCTQTVSMAERDQDEKSHPPFASQSTQYLLSSSFSNKDKMVWCFSCNNLSFDLDILGLY
jgi:hypothetical protein